MVELMRKLLRVAKIKSKEEIRPWLDETLKAKNVVWGMDTENTLSKILEQIS